MLVNPLRIVFTLALSSAIGVSAQTPDACILGCINAGLAKSTCTSLTDLTCICSSASFQSAVAACLTLKCTAADQQAALQLQKQECSSSSSTSSSGASSTPTSTSSSASSNPTPSSPSSNPTSSSPSSNPTSSSPSSNSTSPSSPAISQKSSNAITSIEQLPLLTVFVAIASVALGGAFTF